MAALASRHRVSTLGAQESDKLQEILTTMEFLRGTSTDGKVTLSTDDINGVLDTLKLFRSMVHIDDLGNQLTGAEDFSEELGDSFLTEYSQQSANLAAKRESTKVVWKSAMRKATIQLAATDAIANAHLDDPAEYVNGIQRAIAMTIEDKVVAFEAATKLVKLGDWDFDMHDLAKLTGSKTLPAVAMTIFDGIHGMISSLKVDLISLCHYIVHISEKYDDKNPYHNSLHGADVGQSVYHFMRQKSWGSHFNSIETFGTIVASFVHDVGHTGMNNSFLVKTKNEIALRYNDQSPLENMHIAIAWEGLRTPYCNFVENMDEPMQSRFREVLIKTVLGTDNAFHFEHVNKLKELVFKGKAAGKNFRLDDSENRDLMLQLILHAADLSNPTKPWTVYKNWCDAIMEEFYLLGDLEEKAGLPVTHIFKRDTLVADVQLGFIKFLVRPFFQALGTIEGMTGGVKDMLKNIEANLQHWEKEKKDTVAAREK